jgi:hypothetical protein
MTLTILLVIASILLVVNLFLWKHGYVGLAEKPEAVLDRPVMDPKERKAFLKRLKRWKEEGKINRADFEKFYALCTEEWDQEDITDGEK